MDKIKSFPIINYIMHQIVIVKWVAISSLQWLLHSFTQTLLALYRVSWSACQLCFSIKSFLFAHFAPLSVNEWCSVLLCSADFKHSHWTVHRTQAKFEIIGVSTNKLLNSAFSEFSNGNRKNVYLSRFRTAFLQIKQYIMM